MSLSSSSSLLFLLLSSLAPLFWKSEVANSLGVLHTLLAQRKLRFTRQTTPEHVKAFRCVHLSNSSVAVVVILAERSGQLSDDILYLLAEQEVQRGVQLHLLFGVLRDSPQGLHALPPLPRAAEAVK